MAKFITKEIEKKLAKFPLYSQQNKGEDAEIIVKFFNPYGSGTWYVLEGEKKEDGDWLLYGLVDLHEREYGYFSLKELEEVRINIRGCKLPLEIDRYFSKKYIKEIN